MTTGPLEPRRPVEARNVLSYVWALSPMISVGFLTPFTFAIAWVRCRTLSTFASFIGYTGLFFLQIVAQDVLEGFGAVLHILISLMLATVHALLIRQKVLAGSADAAGASTSSYLQPSTARAIGSFVWALSPALSLSLLTPATFAISMARLRTFSSFLSFAAYTGVLIWWFTADDPLLTFVTGFSLTVSGLVGTAHAFVMRQRTWFQTAPEAEHTAPAQTHFEGPVAAPDQYSSEPQSPGSYYTAPNPYTPEPESEIPEPTESGMEKATLEPDSPPAQVEADPAEPESVLEIQPLPSVLQPEPEQVETPGLGVAVCRSDAYLKQVKGLRRVPDPEAVGAIIDAAEKAGGLLTVAAISRITGKPAANISGYVSQLQRVLNVDGTQVLAKVDDGNGIRIDLDLLRQQFLGGNR
jgi:hypothetical protein